MLVRRGKERLTHETLEVAPLSRKATTETGVMEEWSSGAALQDTEFALHPHKGGVRSSELFGAVGNACDVERFCLLQP